MQKKVKSLFDGVEIFYDHYYQSSNQQTLVLIHGWCCNRTFWKNQIEPFSKDYNIISLDLAGHGMSLSPPRKEWSLDSLSADLLSVLKEESPEDIIFVGHSLGDVVVLKMLDSYNEFNITGLLGIDNFYYVAQALEDEKRIGVTEYFKADYPKAIKETAYSWVVDPEKNAEVVKFVFDEMIKVPEDISMEVGAYSLMEHSLECIKSIDFPIRIVASTEWTEDRAEHLYQKFKDVSITYMDPMGGHFPMLEHPEKFNSILRDLLAEICEPSRIVNESH